MIAEILPPADWTQLSVGVAAVLGLIYVARSFSKNSKDLLQFLSLSMKNVSSSIESLALSVGTMNERLTALHEDNRRLAEALIRTAEAEVASIRDFEMRVKDRHLALADRLPPKTGKALREAILEEEVRR